MISHVINDLGNLLKAAAQRILGPSRVFNQYREAAFDEIESVTCCCDRSRGLQKSLLAIGATKRAWMQNQIFGAYRQCPLDLSTKRFDRFLEKVLSDARQVDEIVRVYHQGLQIVFLPQPFHLIALRTPEFVLRPLPGT